MKGPPTSPAGSPLPAVVRGVGCGCLLLTAGVHLSLYLHAGYRHIPTIGSLFLLQFGVSVVFALALLIRPAMLIGVLAAGFLASVLAGYALAATVGLFGFRETGQVGAAWLAGAAEAGGTLVLAGAVAWSVRGFVRSPTSAPSAAAK
jgi:hypothetical protein